MNNNPAKNAATPSFLGNSGTTSIPINHPPQPTHLLSQSQPQTQGASHFPGHFQLSQPQTQVLAQQPQFAHPPQTQQQQHQQPVNQLHNNVIANTNVATTTTATATATAKRATQKPPSRPSGSSNANQPSPFKTMELTPAPPRRKRNLPDKQIPEKVAKLLPECALYTQLLELEARIDAALIRKKIDIQEAVRNPPHVRRTLRIYVYNTFSNQDKKNLEEPPSWSLRITGRILEDGKDPVAAGISQTANPSYPKFSAFFKKITIYLDQGFHPDNHVIVWDSARSPLQRDGFEVKRKGDKEFTAVVRIAMNNSPEKFMVSAQLSKVLGIEFDTRPRIIAALWHYVKSRKLQSPNDPSFFMCDASLQRVFGEEKMKFSMASQKISQHLSQPQPIHLEHKIKLSGNCPAGTTCYDVQVDVPLPLEKDMSAFLASSERHKEFDAFDEVICASIKKIHEHRRRRAFFLGFSQSPAEFINALIASQSKDLKLVAGDASHNAENERRSEFYNQSWIEDAVIRYLNRKTARSDAPGGV
ncbi:SWI/SNF complex component SNF12 homolog [Gastrolobium bilobum]|uniref:SWI/SNF complex component SNF12 homolog n=1 Tax=Gastrolobium bilobum TaxID=150636 RepID=UPI002AB237CF|nr:SWI/SNF complex component SNF12 homolog [Gastrolobium bilobum]